MIWVINCFVPESGFGILWVDSKREEEKLSTLFFSFFYCSCSSQEAEFKMRKLEMMKQKKLTLEAEVKYDL